MRILVVCPTLSEFKHFKEVVNKSKDLKNVYSVRHSGVGKVNTASLVSVELAGVSSVTQGQYDLIAVIGYAAGSSIYKQGDIVVPSSTRYWDCLVPEGMTPELTALYSLEGPDECTVLTGDSFVTADIANSLVPKYGESIVFDMEASAVCQVASDYSIPVIVIKVISDVPQQHNYQTFTEFAESWTDFSPFLNYLENL